MNNIITTTAQQDANEHNETAVDKTENYDKNSVQKGIINLKNDLEEIRNTYYQNSDNQSTNKKDLSNLGNDTKQYIKGNNNNKK